MTRKIISLVQEYLTYCGEDRVYQIVNVEVLLKRHPPEAVKDRDVVSMLTAYIRNRKDRDVVSMLTNYGRYRI